MILNSPRPVFTVVFYREARILHIVSNSGLPYVRKKILQIFESLTEGDARRLTSADDSPEGRLKIACDHAMLVVVHRRESYWVCVVFIP